MKAILFLNYQKFKRKYFSPLGLLSLMVGMLFLLPLLISNPTVRDTVFTFSPEVLVYFMIGIVFLTTLPLLGNATSQEGDSLFFFLRRCPITDETLRLWMRMNSLLPNMVGLLFKLALLVWIFYLIPQRTERFSQHAVWIVGIYFLTSLHFLIKYQGGGNRGKILYLICTFVMILSFFIRLRWDPVIFMWVYFGSLIFFNITLGFRKRKGFRNYSHDRGINPRGGSGAVSLWRWKKLPVASKNLILLRRGRIKFLDFSLIFNSTMAVLVVFLWVGVTAYDDNGIDFPWVLLLIVATANFFVGSLADFNIIKDLQSLCLQLAPISKPWKFIDAYFIPFVKMNLVHGLVVVLCFWVFPIQVWGYLLLLPLVMLSLVLANFIPIYSAHSLFPKLLPDDLSFIYLVNIFRTLQLLPLVLAFVVGQIFLNSLVVSFLIGIASNLGMTMICFFFSIKDE
ncbi:MAG: hypothetical protein FWF59_12695 [Turicibacter sp.]|nr:hypothetical protein [Turicibacter sp.]